ncbi:DNA polymerase-1 [Prauserella shujinwangii]|uniref:DNA-directed DNA polymerase n=1 Tax=Prauserella shujinwangii TaxID=1453103 RepID=A0A2T0LTR7_9PSEU|nr:bifunctional 3'-5' exonuclease/DNA polymerase [Prauserella shujinwangii]PRX47130.1 DNA polymerase-1 [Prauserella shujinwangii]
MHIIVARDPDGTFAARAPEGGPAASGLSAAELARHAAGWERELRPRWVFTSVEHDYPALLGGGVRVRRCHDLALTEGLLLAAEERGEQPRSLAAAYARARGLEPPAEVEYTALDDQPALFQPRGPGLPGGVAPLDAAELVLAEQRRRIGRVPHPDRMRLLVAAESASALAAAEMSADGLPWRADVHDALLTELLGGRVPAGQRPPKLAALAERIQEAFGGRPVNPDHPGSVVRAFGRAGIEVPSARAHVLRALDHPAVEPLLEYKELARLHSAHGWAWLEHWVHGDRFRPVYVVGGVVSGRWASRGGAALQIPRALRVCVRADPGWKLVVADAAQLEPRVLAALSGDRGLARVSASADLYDSLADAMFGQARGRTPDDRGRAKIAMLSAMYGGTAGEAASLLALLRQRFPEAVSYVERAALAGERGEVVRSRLGRTSPPPSAAWRALTGGTGDEGTARRAARDWGRFTRNFVVQASAADWTAVLLATLRGRLPEPARLVFFQHDEVLVHAPAGLAERVRSGLEESVREASALVFGTSCPVRFPMAAAVVDCYADAK